MGTLSQQIIQAFLLTFQDQCLELVCRAHSVLLSMNSISRDTDEETISTCICQIMRDTLLTSTAGIHVDIEHRLIPIAYATNPSPAKQLPRIDFHFESNSFNAIPACHYYMEAKNLYEHDFQKNYNKTLTSAVAYQNRYINTGINHIVSGYYPKSTTMLGYVLEGDIPTIVQSLNSILCAQSRFSEQLSQFMSYTPSTQELYVSQHIGGYRIVHVMMRF